jgi:hypothetical protein
MYLLVIDVLLSVSCPDSLRDFLESPYHVGLTVIQKRVPFQLQNPIPSSTRPGEENPVEFGEW